MENKKTDNEIIAEKFREIIQEKVEEWVDDKCWSIDEMAKNLISERCGKLIDETVQKVIQEQVSSIIEGKIKEFFEKGFIKITSGWGSTTETSFEKEVINTLNKELSDYNIRQMAEKLVREKMTGKLKEEVFNSMISSAKEALCKIKLVKE